jgi:hypothetical protein
VYFAMEVSIGRLVHVILGPLMETRGFYGLTPIACILAAIEVVASLHIKEPVDLLAH